MARRYTMVNTPQAPPDKPSKGQSSIVVRDLFPASPIYLGKAETVEDFSDAGITKWYQNNVMDAEIIDDGTFAKFNTGFVNGKGWDVETGGGGLPANRYVPNPVSPGPGSDNPTDIQEAPAGFSSAPPSAGTYGDGGSRTSPEATSIKIANMTIGHYLMGEVGTAE